MRTQICRKRTTYGVRPLSVCAPTARDLKTQIARCDQVLKDMKRLQDSLRNVLGNHQLQKPRNGAAKAALRKPRGRLKEARRRTVFVPESGYSPAA
jgi:hypothetical protein